jgi:hypothetical protein
MTALQHLVAPSPTTPSAALQRLDAQASGDKL